MHDSFHPDYEIAENKYNILLRIEFLKHIKEYDSVVHFDKQQSIFVDFW